LPESITVFRLSVRLLPPAVLEQKSGFRLSAGKAELARVARDAPCRMVLAQRPQALRNVGFGKPFDFRRRGAEDDLKAVRTDELNRAGAVFADGGDKTEGVPGGNMEFPRPLIEH
jgi:hypothetical protein